MRSGPGCRKNALRVFRRSALAKERAERRLTAILAADVAGYSRLMGADEEGTLAQLKAALSIQKSSSIADGS
jgi:adenylate cyclase